MQNIQEDVNTCFTVRVQYETALKGVGQKDKKCIVVSHGQTKSNNHTNTTC